ncbi:MAG: RdgB/HAM1 family non-canonical purine NTP pyrophosphatase [candidate division WOR-3 bacterium]
MKIFLATNNKGKIKEIKEILSDLAVQILTPQDLKIKFICKEDGDNFYENAYKKAIAGLLQTGYITIGEDSGLMIDYLNGAPGLKSARFTKRRNPKENIKKVLNLLKGVKKEERKAKFKCVIALALSLKKVKFFEGECEGYISNKEMGNKGFGYDPIFIPKGYNKTFALLGEEKNKISHRAKALFQLKNFLKTIIK